MIKNECKTIDEFISLFEPSIQIKLEALRNLIKEVAPDAEESINYHIPTFKLKKKVLVHFSAYKTHIGFYPTPSPIQAFKEKLINYKTSKGTIQFTMKTELPMELIKEIVQYRVAEVLESLK